MTLRATSLDCRSCNGSGAITGHAGLDACGRCAAWARRAWEAAQRGQPLPAHLAPTPIRPRPSRGHQHHRSIA